MNSVLNPEAPEFYPHLTSFTQGGYVKINQSIKSSNKLPSGTSYGFFKTFTDFHILTSQLSENVILQSNQIITSELPGMRLKRNDEETNTDKIIEVNDNILDRININIDTASGVNVSNVPSIQGLQTGRIGTPWNSSPVIAKIQVGSATFIGAKNITRPQINFKDTIDNSDSLWVPKISDKPNSIKPLALNILYNDEGEAVGYEHPYLIELDQYEPPSQFLEPMEPLPYPAALEETTFTYVDTEAKLDALVEHLNTVTEIAVDLEHHSYRTYQGITCLIQVTTTEGGDFIIDALAIREHIHKLNLAFTDPKKLKVFHGADHDVIWLQRDFGVYLVGLFDTHKAAVLLNLSGLSLKYLLQRYCQLNADKKYQLADWRMRPLPEELIQYARMDTHYLLYIWRLMKAELSKDEQTRQLRSVFETSRQLCGNTYNKEVITDTSHMPLYVRSKKSFNTQQMAAMKLLYKWRDAQARVLDESTTYLLPNHMLLALAESLPREVQGVTAICQPMPPFVKQNLITVHRMLLSCRELPNEPQLFEMPTSIRNVINATRLPLATYTVHDLQHYSDLRFHDKFKVPNCIGCIDGTYVSMVRPSYNEERYFCRKGYHARNVQLVTDADLNILHADASYGGATHDNFIFNHSELKQHLEELGQSEETFLLGDSGYAQRAYLMTPVEDAEERTPEAYFNKLHGTARNSVERAIGLLKGRFRCLLVHRVLHYNPDMVAKIVIACCVLHNICNRAGLPAPVISGPGNDSHHHTNRILNADEPAAGDDALTIGRNARNALIHTMWIAR